MLKNNIKIAFRNLLKYKIYSTVNIIGLTIGMTCTILLSLFVQNELSFDNYYPEASNIYRITGDFKMAGQEYKMAVVPPIMAKVVIDEFPEVGKAVRFRNLGSQIVKYENQSFNEPKIGFVDNSIIEIFALNVLEGDVAGPLNEPNSVILSETAASKYFGGENAVGKVLNFNNRNDYKVTAVYKDIPQNTHFDYDFLISMPSLEESKQVSWLSNNFQTYLVINKNADIQKLEEKFTSLLEKYLGPELEKAMGVTLAQFEQQGGGGAYNLQPVTEIHLYSDLMGEMGQNSDVKYVYIFSIIAAFILLIACVNFVNISTARSATRAKEVGIRKVLGSYRRGLIKQFLTESLLTTLVSMILAIGLIELAMPYFNNLTGKELSMDYFGNPFIIFSMITVLGIIGLLAGSYPAFVLSAYNPVQAFAAKIKASTKSGYLRSGLVVFQFTASIIMIISTFVVLNQLNYIQNKKLGFNKENVVVLDFAYLLGDQVSSFKQEMLSHPEIKSATVSAFLPVPSGFNSTMVWPVGRKEEGASIQLWDVDHDYLETMKINLAEGRNFSIDFPTDSFAVILNEAAVKQFNITDPIGKRIARPYNFEGHYNEFEIIGIAEDFHYQTLRDGIAPLAIFIGSSNGSISFRTNTADMSGVINILKEKWNKFVPGQPFNYSFLDERFENIYRGEQQVSEIFGIFALLAVFIGCLGLFSLSAFTAEQKTKEIGIRKVLGSSISSIVLMLSKEFLQLVVISFVIAIPVAYYFMNKWLNDFEYKTDLSVSLFLGAGFIAFIIAMLTVSYHALKAANANPVKALKYE